MSLRICVCCGEPIAEKGDALFRDPNICASCLSLADGMPDSAPSRSADFDAKMPLEADFPQVTAEAMLWEHMRKVATMSQ
ncbi:MAG TPA: hypothetical protein VNZ64_07100 [Candidatus Acidoferrum sp.]|jgi:hypothetical protein|nr:hypothetical protein [Candidatus Acidoferrum sp.]